MKKSVEGLIILAVASLIVSIVGVSVSVIQQRYYVRGVDSSYQWKSTFQKKSICVRNCYKETLDTGQCQIWCKPKIRNTQDKI